MRKVKGITKKLLRATLSLALVSPLLFAAGSTSHMTQLVLFTGLERFVETLIIMITLPIVISSALGLPFTITIPMNIVLEGALYYGLAALVSAAIAYFIVQLIAPSK